MASSRAAGGAEVRRREVRLTAARRNADEQIPAELTIDADHAAGAAAIVHHHRLPEQFGQLRREYAHQNVHRRAGRLRRNQADRALGKLPGAGNSSATDRQSSKNENACHDMVCFRTH